MVNISIILLVLAIVVKKSLQMNIAMVRLTILIIKNSFEGLLKTVTSAFNVAKKNVPKIALLKILMAINDVPFATIFRPIKDMMNGQGNLLVVE